MSAKVHSIEDGRALLERPTIEARSGELPRLVREAEDALISQRAGIYQRAGQLVRIVKLDSATEQHGIRRDAGSTIITPLTREYLGLALARAAEWQRFDGRARKMRPVDPPSSVAAALMACVGEWRTPTLTGLVAAPTLRPDGSLLAAPGYDSASGLYGAFDPGDFPEINPKPSRDDALAAHALLADLFAEFDFSGGAPSPHASVTIAATITAAVRHALPTAPAIGISAAKQGSGKTTAALAISQVCTGRRPPVLALSDDEAELRKTLLAILIAGDACVLIDNVAKPVDSAALCALLTSATYSDRVLGINQRVVVPTASTWLITGNQLEFVGDLTTRVLLSVLDPEMENPEARPFKRNLADYVTENRGRLLAAALTIPLAYLAAGGPALPQARSRFAEWDRLVRRPLLWLGVADPLATQEMLRSSDPEREALVAVLHAWREAFSEQPTSVARAVQSAAKADTTAYQQLLEALTAVAGNPGGAINSRRLGRYLVRHLRRIEAGMRLEDGGPDLTTKNRRFRAVGVTGVISVSANPTREMSGNSSVVNGRNTEKTDNTPRKCPACDGEGCDWCLSTRMEAAATSAK